MTHYNAGMAVMQSINREMRYKEIYDRIVSRCVEKISETASQTRKRSIIYQVPARMDLDCMNYNIDAAIEYVMTKLRDDMHFIVKLVDPANRKIYVAWRSQEEVDEEIARRGGGGGDDLFPQELPSLEKQRRKYRQVLDESETNHESGVVSSAMLDADKVLHEVQKYL